MWVSSLGREDPLEEEVATHSSVLAWKIPWTEEPGGVQSTGLQRSQTLFTTEQQQLSKNLACPAIRDVGNKLQECRQHC